MQVTIEPGLVKGLVQVPISKSAMQRACAAAFIRKGTTIIRQFGISNDDKAAIDIIQQLGAIVHWVDDYLQIESNGLHNEPIENKINCGESGLSIRMFTPLAALHNNAITIEGSGSLLSRPMHFFDEILPLLQVTIQSNSGKLPLVVKGSLQPVDITIDGSLSSQFLTGLLMAYAAALPNALQESVTITVNNLASKPYIDLTLYILEEFRLPVPENNQYQQFIFRKNNVNSSPAIIDYTVEGDWSGAAFLLVAGAIAGNIVVKGLDVFSTQADKKILEALVDCGCTLSVTPQEIQVALPATGLAGLKPFQFNATDCPDLFPPLVALATFCNGTSVIEGVHRLTHKESNRAVTLQEEFAKMGVEIMLQDNLMIVKGGVAVKASTVHSRHDHRIAMACATAALQAAGNVTIDQAEAINKSYPAFFDDLQSVGAKVYRG